MLEGERPLQQGGTSREDNKGGASLLALLSRASLSDEGAPLSSCTRTFVTGSQWNPVGPHISSVFFGEPSS
jgi:hypothetical protein